MFRKFTSKPAALAYFAADAPVHVPSARPAKNLVSHIVFSKSFCKSLIPHTFVNFLFIQAIVKDKLKDFWEG